MPRLLISCGEPSGEFYAAELVAELRKRHPDLEAFGLGGDRLAATNVRLLAHLRDLAVVGLVEVLSHLRRLKRLFDSVVAEAARTRPDVAVLIDYPDFNLRLARELLDGHPLCKLEVLGDPTNLFPNMPETLKAAETLVKEGFEVMVYCADDPIQCKMLEEIGCVAVMPLASLIGSGMGIVNPWNLRLIIDNAKVPIIVDAGVGTASDATIAMEGGCDGVLMNTAIAHAKDPVLMASAMKKGIEAGREAYLAGRMARKYYSADPSSPTTGLIGS